jgi:lysozyme
MNDPRKPVFDAVRPLARAGLFGDPGNVLALDNLLDAFDVPRAAAIGHNGPPADALTMRMVLEILEHEAIVQEAYKDSVGVWTWGVGVTGASGHHVDRYKDKPAPIARCIEIYVWLLRTKYLPEVLSAFAGHPLAEHELAAALSFHWNTGAIGKADWVKMVKAGQREAARAAFLNYSRPKEVIGRRKCERALFFDGIWMGDGLVPHYGVAKPSYAPRWSSRKLIDVREDVAKAMADA